MAGTLYIGYHKKGFSEGYGRHIFDHPCGDPGVCNSAHDGYYEGLFKNDKPHGWGKEIKSNGEVHEGMNADGLKHGLGRLRYENGDQYEGEFNKDLEHGNGIVKMPSGAYFWGTYQDGMKHGFGVWTDEIFKRYGQIFTNNQMDEEFEIKARTISLEAVQTPLQPL